MLLPAVIYLVVLQSSVNKVLIHIVYVWQKWNVNSITGCIGHPHIQQAVHGRHPRMGRVRKNIISQFAVAGFFC